MMNYSTKPELEKCNEQTYDKTYLDCCNNFYRHDFKRLEIAWKRTKQLLDRCLYCLIK